MPLTLRRVFAPLSITLCIAFSFGLAANLYGMTVEPPPLVNAKFRYLTRDPATRELKPYGWALDLITGPKDQAYLRRDVVAGELCLGMHVVQDGVDDGHEWATIHVRQDLTGTAAQALFNQPFTIAVFPTFPYVHDSGYPRNVFGVEIYDGNHLLWIVFSNTEERTDQINQHRIIVIRAPSNEWSVQKIDLAAIYRAAGWQPPEKYSFTLLVGATRALKGEFAGFVKEVTSTEKSRTSAGSLEALISSDIECRKADMCWVIVTPDRNSMRV
ncbi:MAG: hypothetical protein V1857_05385 [archaeon]